MENLGSLIVLGVPSDENSSHHRGTAEAPARIREVLHSPAGNLCVESGLDLGTAGGWRDAGDLEIDPKRRSFEQIEVGVARLLGDGARVVILGGDHAITYPVIRTHARHVHNLTILHVDAHPDLYDELDGNRLSHACPFARIMEERLAVRLVSVGIRAATPHQREQAMRFGVETISAAAFEPSSIPELKAPVYLSLDLDVLDPAFAPGVSHPEPGGLSTRQVVEIVKGLSGKLVGADIVELNPRRDPSGITAAAAAKLLKETIAAML